MSRIYFYICAVTFLSACSMGGIVKISEPSLGSNEIKAQFKDGIFYSDKISLSVKPKNKEGKLLTIGPLIFPVIPIGFGSNLEREKEFLHIVVQFDTKENNYIFDPTGVILNIDGKSYRPNSISEFITKTGPAREGNRSIPGHNWTCDFSGIVSQSSLIKKFKVQKGCLVLEYSLETPEPEKEFNIRINGLSIFGANVEIPTIFFKSSYKGTFFLLMSN